MNTRNDDECQSQTSSLSAERYCRRQHFEMPITEEVVADSLLDFLNQTWNIFGVSALFGFKIEELQLKLYAKFLREQVAGALTQEDVTYDAKFYVLEDITPRPSPMDPPIIKIEVYSKHRNQGQEPEKCIYRGMLISWNTRNSYNHIKNAVRFPLLLCRGTTKAVDTVHITLSRMFDCTVIALTATNEDLMWLIPIIISPVNDNEHTKSTDEIVIEYVVPGLPVTETISIKFNVLDLTKVLKVIKNDKQQGTDTKIVFQLEDIEKFYQNIHTQMLSLSGLQLELCILRRINLPPITIMGNRMKVKNPDILHRMLIYLNEKALNILYLV